MPCSGCSALHGVKISIKKKKHALTSLLSLIDYVISLFYQNCHSHKIWKDSLETRAKRTVLHAYVQAIFEPILL